jgi:uridine kinase
VIAALAAAASDHERIAVDGPDAAGKTTFAGGLADALARDGRECTRLTIDDFLRPAAERYRRGDLSPEGYYEDAFDLDAFAAAVEAAPGIVVADGVFLQRPELAHLWTLVVYLDCAPEVTLRRALVRDRERFGSHDAVLERYAARYLPAQEQYRRAVDPAARADVVLRS